MKRIVIVGSLNMDVVMETRHIPKEGETVCASSLTLVPGGKGANQAYAAGMLCGDVGIIGAVGDDEYGTELITNLNKAGVDTSGISVLEGEATGQAYIAVDERGENSIIIVAGTNGLVTKETIRDNVEEIKKSDIIMMQMEIPLEVVEYVKELAVEMGKLIILDPAPASPNLPDHFLDGIDYIKPNETELEILVGKKINHLDDIREGAHILLEKGVKNVIVSMGEEGCLLVSEKKEKYFPANHVQTVDTTAAGDSFTAGFAVALSQGKECEEAIEFGQVVSSIVVSRKGAQTSIPTLEEVLSKTIKKEKEKNYEYN